MPEEILALLGLVKVAVWLVPIVAVGTFVVWRAERQVPPPRVGEPLSHVRAVSPGDDAGRWAA